MQHYGYRYDYKARRVGPEMYLGPLPEWALAVAERVYKGGLMPRVALLSHSSFGSADTRSARKMRQARAMLRERAPELEVEGEMQGDAALSMRIL